MKNSKNQALVEWQERMKRGEVEIERIDPIEKARRNPNSLRAAINGKCWDCSCGQRSEVTRCEARSCPLWNVRPWQKQAVEEDAA